MRRRARGFVLGVGLAGLVGCAATGVRIDEIPDDPIAISYRTPEESLRRADDLEDAQDEDSDEARPPELEEIGRYLEEAVGHTRERPELQGRLALLHPRTGEVEIVEAAIRGAVPLDWSPDRRRLMFTHRAGGHLQLMEFDREKRQLRALTRGHEAHPRGCYGPEGRIVIQAVNLRKNQSRILITDRAGRNPRRLTKLDVTHSPACAPDGSAIAYVAMMPDGREHIVTHLPALDGEPRTIAPGRSPRFSPDGRWIVYAAPSLQDDETYKLWRIRPDGTGRAPLGRGLFDERRPAFSPDGRLVVYVTESRFRPWLYLRRFDGTGDRVFFQDGDADHPVW